MIKPSDVSNFEQIAAVFNADSRGELENVLHNILISPEISSLDKFNFAIKAVTIIKNHSLSFQREVLVPIEVLGTAAEICVPFSLIRHSDALHHQYEDEPGSALLMISPPPNFSIADFERYSRYLDESKSPIPDLATWVHVRQLADRFCCDQETIDRLNERRPRLLGTLEELEGALELQVHLSPLITTSLISDVLNKYLNGNPSIEKMRKSPIFQHYIGKIPIDLVLPEVNDSEVKILASCIPNVQSLKVTYRTGPLDFPAVWTNTLSNLTIYSSKTSVTIPEELLSRLSYLDLHYTSLCDYSVLNDRTNLETLIYRCCYRAVIPRGLVNLKSFESHGCKDLVDFSNLNNLRNLQNLWINNCPILKFPVGLENLIVCALYKCNALTDFSGLDNLLRLETCMLQDLPNLLKTPSGCVNLKTLTVY